MSANEGSVLDVYHGLVRGCQSRWPVRANQSTIQLSSNMAMGAVRWAAARVQPWGSSKPRCCLAS